MSLDSKRILVVYDHRDAPEKMRLSIKQHLHALEMRAARHDIYYHNSYDETPDWLPREAFDVVQTGCLLPAPAMDGKYAPGDTGIVDELPVISATPETIHDVLVDLITHPEKRREIGEKSREFAVKWHSAEAGARRFVNIYRSLLKHSRSTYKLY